VTGEGSQPVEIAGPVDMVLGGGVEQVLIPEELISQRVRELGTEISREYRNLEPLVVGVLKGSFVFLADLIRAIDIPITMDFLAVQSYTSGRSTGEIHVTQDLGIDITGRHVLLVEDILDTGLTIRRITEHLQVRDPASLAFCALLEKRNHERRPMELRYIGFRIPDVYVVGYGLDYNGNFRNLPFIGIYGRVDIS
jgi:hypoxanthine phosphoribosyltransferase